MPLKGVPALLGKGKPGPGAFAYVALSDLYVAAFLQKAHPPGQGRVRDPDGVPEGRKDDLVGCLERGNNREPDRLVDKLVQPVARVGQRDQRFLIEKPIASRGTPARRPARVAATGILSCTANEPARSALLNAVHRGHIHHG